MIGILLLVGIFWVFAQIVGIPVRIRLGALLMLYLGILLALGLRPELGAAIGGTAGEWLVLGAIGVAVWLYGKFIGRLRKRANATAPAPAPGETFTATERERYARHIVLREIGGAGQKRLKQARVLVIGAGGLGAPALQYLAAAGVGTIGVIDDDVVDNSNLQRQVIHKDAAIGMPKVQSAAAEMKAQNPGVTVLPYNRKLDEATAEPLFADFDLILDGTDNFTTRYLVNRVAAKLGKPLISGALSQWEGQISLFDPAKGGPCYECVFPTAPADGLAPTCAEAGVLGPLPGVIGSMMAVEAIKYVARTGETLTGRMMIYDALYAECRILKLSKRADCPVCGTPSN